MVAINSDNELHILHTYKVESLKHIDSYRTDALVGCYEYETTKLGPWSRAIPWSFILYATLLGR